MSGLFTSGQHVLAEVFHQAFIEVNEEGTTATAATAVVVVEEAPHMTPMVRADHPFLFLIRDVQTGFILFMGQVTDPE